MKAAHQKSILFVVLATSIALNSLTSQKAFAEDAAAATQVTPPPQNSDRKEGAGAAQAMAIAGAAMAGMSCIMMMNEARKMPPGSEKNMTMMMAMQQCSQAAQSAANAGKNDKAKNAVSQNDTPKMAGLNAPKPSNAPTPSELPNLPGPEEKKADDSSVASADIPEPSSVASPKLEDPKVDTGLGTDTNYGVKAVSISTLKPIETATIGFNENNKNDSPTTSAPGLGGPGIFGGGKPVGAEELKKLNGSTEVTTVAAKAGRGGKGEGEGALTMEGSGAGGKDEGSGNSAFDQLMTQLMGGGQAGDAVAIGAFGSADLIALPRNKETGKGPNIFEYASYRYRTATFDEGRIATKRRGAKPAEPAKTTALLLKND